MKCRKKVDLITTKNTNWQYNSQKMCIFAIENILYELL